MEAIEISIENLNKFPKDIVALLQQMAEKRMQFIKKRVLEITKGLSTDEATGYTAERKKQSNVQR